MILHEKFAYQATLKMSEITPLLSTTGYGISLRLHKPIGKNVIKPMQ
jgi:hypothetical protein